MHRGDSVVAFKSVTAPINEANSSQEKDLPVNLHKSLSVKLSTLDSPAKSESDCSRASIPKARLNPFRKVFDPFVKFKSHRSILSSSNETGSEKINGLAEIRRNKICKSFLYDKSDKPGHVEYCYQFEEKENCNSVPESSPAHLHGLLKSGNKHGVPFFEFSVKSPEDVYVAKTWKVEKALTLVYTFHSLHHRRKNKASGWGISDSNRESSMVGQMHVSCHLHTEFIGAGELNDSMVTEFVLYDIIHSRKSTSEDYSKAPLVSDDISWGNCELNEISAKAKTRSELKHSHESDHFESSASASHPQAAAELHPELEIAAIVMEVPIQKRESLKSKNGEKKIDETFPNLLGVCHTSSPEKMHVVIPAGHHSLPITESRGPSTLLDRWRLGGGCDCGGWDMSCPLNVFSNPNVKVAECQPLMANRKRTELIVQGGKDNIPAFTMRLIKDGKYAVDFHAQLSSLQAFSVCIAVLHAAEVSAISGQEGSNQMLQSNPLRAFREDEIENMTDAIPKEDKVNKMKQVLPSFVLNPPFSPIARV